MTVNDNNAVSGGAAPTATVATKPVNNDFTIKAGLAQMLKGGVIMDVVNAEQVAASLSEPSSNSANAVYVR